MITDILPQLIDVKQTASNKWLALCPAHDDSNPSLSLIELPDGRVRMKCWTGCDNREIVNAIGHDLRVLYPQSVKSKNDFNKSIDDYKRKQLIEIMNNERLILAMFHSDIAKRKHISRHNTQRALLSTERIRKIKQSGVVL